MKTRIGLLLLAFLFLSSSAFAAAINLSTFAPPNNPSCQLQGTDPSTPGSPLNGPILAAVGDVITITLVVTNGNFTGPTDLIVNGTSFNYGVTMPIQVTASAPGMWNIQFATVGCVGSVLTIIAH